MIDDLTPRLPARLFAKTVAFYQEVLGFEISVAWPSDNPSFVILRREGASIGFSAVDDGADGPTHHPVELYFRVRDVRATHSQLKDNVAVEWGPEVYSYGCREFAVRDPEGHLLIFSEPTNDPPTTEEPN